MISKKKWREICLEVQKLEEARQKNPELSLAWHGLGVSVTVELDDEQDGDYIILAAGWDGHLLLDENRSRKDFQNEREAREDFLGNLKLLAPLTGASPGKIIMYVEGGVVHDVQGVPAGVTLEVRDADIEGCDEEDLTEIDGETFRISTYEGEQ